MIISDIISTVLLSVLLFWTAYNGSIIYMGIRGKRKQQFISSSTVKGELPKFSIIVPTKNEEKVIRRCLNSIFNLDYPKDKMEVIVVDGKSATTPARYARSFPRNIHKSSNSSTKTTV